MLAKVFIVPDDKNVGESGGLVPKVVRKAGDCALNGVALTCHTTTSMERCGWHGGVARYLHFP